MHEMLTILKETADTIDNVTDILLDLVGPRVREQQYYIDLVSLLEPLESIIKNNK